MDWQLTWSCNIRSFRHFFLKLEKILTTKTSVELSPPAPEFHQDWSQYGSRVLIALGTNAEHTGKASPATRLMMWLIGWVNVAQASVGRNDTLPSALKWKYPLQGCYWQYFSTFCVFQNRSIYSITVDPDFFPRYISKNKSFPVNTSQ